MINIASTYTPKYETNVRERRSKKHVAETSGGLAPIRAGGLLAKVWRKVTSTMVNVQPNELAVQTWDRAALAATLEASPRAKSCDGRLDLEEQEVWRRLQVLTLADAAHHFAALSVPVAVTSHASGPQTVLRSLRQSQARRDGAVGLATLDSLTTSKSPLRHANQSQAIREFVADCYRTDLISEVEGYQAYPNHPLAAELTPKKITVYGQAARSLARELTYQGKCVDPRATESGVVATLLKAVFGVASARPAELLDAGTARLASGQLIGGNARFSHVFEGLRFGERLAVALLCFANGYNSKNP